MCVACVHLYVVCGLRVCGVRAWSPCMCGLCAWSACGVSPCMHGLCVVCVRGLRLCLWSVCVISMYLCLCMWSLCVSVVYMCGLRVVCLHACVVCAWSVYVVCVCVCGLRAVCLHACVVCMSVWSACSVSPCMCGVCAWSPCVCGLCAWSACGVSPCMRGPRAWSARTCVCNARSAGTCFYPCPTPQVIRPVPGDPSGLHPVHAAVQSVLWGHGEQVVSWNPAGRVWIPHGGCVCGLACAPPHILGPRCVDGAILLALCQVTWEVVSGS